MSDAPEHEADFEAAEMFLAQAREAHAAGDRVKCFACRRMVALALGLSDVPTPLFHLSHLKAG